MILPAQAGAHIVPLGSQGIFYVCLHGRYQAKGWGGHKGKTCKTTQESHSKPGIEKTSTFITGTKL